MDSYGLLERHSDKDRRELNQTFENSYMTLTILLYVHRNEVAY